MGRPTHILSAEMCGVYSKALRLNIIRELATRAMQEDLKRKPMDEREPGHLSRVRKLGGLPPASGERTRQRPLDPSGPPGGVNSSHSQDGRFGRTDLEFKSMSSPSTRTAQWATSCGAGGPRTLPAVTSKTAPCHGQVTSVRRRRLPVLRRRRSCVAGTRSVPFSR
jgi:hypothetical protein